jgi:chromosome segregation ATPase
MAKLIHILAASVGSGLVLGAGIRLAETIGSSSRQPRKPAAPEWQSALADVVARVDRQQTEVETIRHQVSRAVNALDSVSLAAEDLRSDLQRQLNEDLDRRLAAVEEKLHVSLKASNRETVNAMVASIETRVAPRISRLESDVTVQSTALAELRDCAQQSERSMQRLVSVLERVVNPKPPEQGTAPMGTAPVGTPSESPKLSVVTGRGQEEQGGGGGTIRRPA